MTTIDASLCKPALRDMGLVYRTRQGADNGGVCGTLEIAFAVSDRIGLATSTRASEGRPARA